MTLGWFLGLMGLVSVGGALSYFGQRQVLLRREAFIRNAELPRGLYEALRKRRPDLSLKDCQLVGNGLRQFFLAHLKSGRRYVSMPSQVVDELWHEFILYTKNYDAFCGKAFGRFLHHTPAAVLTGTDRKVNAGLRRCWWYACLEEHINPRRATRLPLLFALDSKLGIGGGLRYVLDCGGGVRREGDGGATVYCGAGFGDNAIDGSLDGFGPGDSADGGSVADGAGGDGGSGCGGGGCGGGGD
jgi:hypothetical protein